jgi:hypothetical protein
MNKLSSIAKKLGQRGGNETLRKYGTEHFKKIGQKRWAKNKVKSTDDFAT